MVAKRLLKEPRTIRRWAAKGLIGGVRKSGPRGHYRIFDRKAFEEWLGKNWLKNSSYEFKHPARIPRERSSEYNPRVRQASLVWGEEQKQKRSEFINRIFSL